MRITGGTLGGRRLVPWEAAGIRPVRDVVRSAIFSILTDFVDDARFLDLFCGTGSVGLEALSRGAAECVFVDLSEAACGIVRRNLEALDLLDRAKVVRADYEQGIEHLDVRGRRFELIFLGPPYRKGLAEGALEILGRDLLLAEDPVVMTELASDEELPDRYGVLSCVDRRVYGDSAVWFYRREASTADEADSEER